MVYDKTYPPNTVDFSPIVRAIQATNPDLIFLASYPPDSAGDGARGERGWPQGADVRRRAGRPAVRGAALTQLEPLLNGLINFETYAPEVAGQVPILGTVPREVPGTRPQRKASIRSATTCRPMRTR